MDKETKDFSLFKLRSTGAIIRDGFQLYMNHFKSIFRSTWTMALIYALVTGGLMNFFASQLPTYYFTNIAASSQLPENSAADEMLLTQFIFFSVAYTVYTMFCFLLAAFGFSLMAEHRDTGNITPPLHWYGKCNKTIFIRTLATWFFMLCISLVATLGNMLIEQLTHYLSSIAHMSLVIGWNIVLACLLIPAMMWLFIYILDPQKRRFFDQPSTLRYWGSTFKVTLIVGIVVFLLISITELPAVILFLATIMSQTGMLQGDPAGMPDYMSWMNLLVFTLAGFIQAYMALASQFPFYYLFGSIETQERERKEAQKNISQTWKQ